MQLFDEINDDNLLIFASRHYYNPKCIDVEEFYEDLNRFKYVKSLKQNYVNVKSNLRGFSFELRERFNFCCCICFYIILNFLF